MKTTSSDWIRIAEQVSNNPFVKIPCPDCSDDFLQILIIPWPGDVQKVDVHLICPNCDTRNTMTKEVDTAYSLTSSDSTDG